MGVAKPRSEPPKAPGTARRSTARSGRVAAARRAAQAASQPTAAVLIVAHNQARRIAATVRASRAIPGVDLVLVVDDGSADNTQHLARKAGAVVVMRDEQGKPPRAVLLMEPGLGNAAIGAAPLVEAVLESVADMAIGLTDGGSKSTGASAGSARKAISSLSGWSPIQPLSRVRCVTREALEAALPLSHGAGLETGMTLDVIDAGLTVTEVECEMRHRAYNKTAATPLARVGKYRDVMMAISSRPVSYTHLT